MTRLTRRGCRTTRFMRAHRYWYETLENVDKAMTSIRLLVLSGELNALPLINCSLAHLSRKYVSHDMAKLIKLQGGPKNFIERLNFIIDRVRRHPCCDEALMTETDLQGYFDVTDEPGQQIPFMYHYAN